MKRQNSFTLKFYDNNLENKFLDFYFKHKLSQQRIALILGLLLYLSFSFLDIIMIPDKKQIFLALRFFGMMPVALLALYLSYQKIFIKYHQLVLFFANLTGGAVIITMILIAQPPVSYLYYAGEILVIIYAFTFSGLRFIWSLVLSLVLITIYEISAVLTDIPLTIIINNNFFFISANFLSLVAAYFIESSMRFDFYNSHLLSKEKEKVTDLNDHLEEMVQIRTEQLKKSNESLQKELKKSRELVEKQKLLQEQLVQSQKMEAIGHLAGGVAHDFNNLLTVINGYAEIILYSLSKNDRHYEAIEQIFEAGQSAASLTAQLLAFSRKQLLQPEIVDIRSLLNKFEKMIRRLLEKHIHLNFEFCEEPLMIEVDPRQLEQVILNLIINARDAMPENGELCIKTAKILIDRPHPTRYHKEKPGVYAVISVIDNGTGMDDNTLQQIFDPFFTTKELGKGTGLGLSTVYGIISQSGGHIYVFSQPGKGTEFDILFPLIENNTAKRTSLSNDDDIYYGKETILLIEDNDDVRKYIENTLKYYNYTILTADNFSRAINIFSQNIKKIDLVISDIMLPGKSGDKIIEELLTLKKDLKYIFISGYSDNILENNGNIKTTGNFIQKPFTRDTLMTKIRNLLNR